MNKRDHGPNAPTLCPVTRQPCMERDCEWWRTTTPEAYDSCVIWHIDQNIAHIAIRVDF